MALTLDACGRLCCLLESVRYYDTLESPGYEGVNRRTATSVRAEFVHLLRVEHDVIVELRPVTDTVAWGSP